MKDKRLEALVAKASKGDKQAFAKLCNQKTREIIYLCVCEMRDQHNGEDAAQEVFIRMQQSIVRLKDPEAFNVWLNRLIHNTCANMKRDSMKHRNAISIDSFDDSFWQDDSDFSLPQEYLENAEKRAQVSEAIENLPEKYRACVMMHYYQSLSYAEIAEVLDISVDAVNNNMRMARKHLKLELEEMGERPAWARGVVPAVAGGPLLSLSLQEAAVTSVPKSVMSRVLTSAGIKVVPVAGSVAKTALPIAAVVALALGAVGVAVNNLRPVEQAPPPSASQSAPVSQAPVTSPPADIQAVFGGNVSLVGGAGLPGVTVSLENVVENGAVLQAETSPYPGTGDFHLDGVPLGSYRLRVVLPDYAGTGTPRVIEVPLGGGDTFTIGESNYNDFSALDVQLDLLSGFHGYLALRLDDEDLVYSEQDLPGIRVQLLDPSGRFMAEAPVAPDGTYYFGNLPITEAGTYTVRPVVEEAEGVTVETHDIQVKLYPGYQG